MSSNNRNRRRAVGRAAGALVSPISAAAEAAKKIHTVGCERKSDVAFS